MKKMSVLLKMLLKPFMNQRGVVGEQGDPPDPNAIELDENGFIPGTNFKSVADLIKGHMELKGAFDKQGNELGQLRGQAQTLAESLKEALTKGDTTKGTVEPADKASEYDAKIAEIETQISKLDPMDENVMEKQAKLYREMNKYTALAQHEKTLGAAKGFLKEELASRDSATAQQKFLDDNKDFNTPEMQTRIKDFLAQDRTGMHDNMSAYFAIKAADAAQIATAATTERDQIKEILKLQHGKDSTGKVIPKGQSPGTVTNPQRVTGEEADAGAKAALAAVRGG
ncbi:MAG TPA: hypothetical protein PK178_14235 [Smithellaceae bacterium]|nr:hypothetical protein [Smithellaceae bacterium]HOQ43315.1 hypothetical protein [Smithellaceae bacterium]